MVAPLRPAGQPAARRLGAGGEAEVYEVPGRPRLAFKRYRQPTPERTAKLRVMLAHPPVVDGGKAAIAWPVELVPGPGGEAAGFLMPRIDLATSVPLFRVYNPQSRHQVAPGFTWRYLLRTARNVAAVVDAVHRAGYVIGDLNESNLLVSNRALVALVDCDSMQVRDPVTGDVHRCRVGKPEFTAPELHRADLGAEDRTEATDAFALAVLVFHLLLEGVHPFGGVWRGRGEPPDIAARIRAGRFPYRRLSRRLAPPPMGLDLAVLPPEVARLVWRTFTAGMRRPSRRPSPAEWLAALDGAEARLTRCRRSPHHEHADHLRRCPWCARIDAGMPDPFPGPTGNSPLRPTPPSWARQLARGARDWVATARRAALAALWSWCRAAPRRAWSGIRSRAGRRDPAAPGSTRLALLLVDVPALLTVAAVASLVPPLAMVAAGLTVLPSVHALAQAAQRGHGRVRTLAAAGRLLPGNMRAAPRAVATAAAWGVSVAIVLAGASAARAADAVTLAAVADRIPGQLRWGGALAAVLLLRWPAVGHADWRRAVAWASARLGQRVRGRRALTAWLVAAAALAAAALA